MRFMGKSLVVAAAVVIACIAIYVWFSAGGMENSQRLYVNSVVLTFNEVKNLIEKDLNRNHSIANQDILYKSWAEASGGKLHGASSVIFGPRGEVVAENDESGIVVIVKPIPTSPGRWTCRTYPEMQFESLCTRMAPKGE